MALLQFSKWPGKGLRLLVAGVSRPFWAHMCYFIGLSLLGALVLLWSPMPTRRIEALDAFFTAVSAVTVSSLGTFPMQYFSEFQLLLITLLMFVGSEVFTSMLCLHFRRFLLHRLRRRGRGNNESGSGNLQPNAVYADKGDSIELIEIINSRRQRFVGKETEVAGDKKGSLVSEMSLGYLGYIALLYLLLVHFAGIVLITLHFSLSQTNSQVLRKAGVKIPIFAVFTVVSSFANCGFIPLNDNLMSFRKDGVSLLIIGVVIMLGNTLYASALWALVWLLGRFYRQRKKAIYDHLLENGWEIYEHMFPARLSLWLIISNMGIAATGTILLCSLQWNDSEGLFEGLDWQHKIAASVFQAISIRHAGENVVDPELIHPAVVFFYIIMMYLPGYILCWNADDEKIEVRKQLWDDASYLTMAILAICITERHKLVSDPLNYKVLNILFEVVSGYGNVGISIGYSCELLRRYRQEGMCEGGEGISFSGRWSSSGKVIIMGVMLFGRLKSIRKNPISSTWLSETRKQTHP